MSPYIFLAGMGLWLAVVAAGCLFARARLRQEANGSTGRAAILVAMTHIPALIRVGPEHRKPHKS